MRQEDKQRKKRARTHFSRQESKPRPSPATKKNGRRKLHITKHEILDKSPSTQHTRLARQLQHGSPRRNAMQCNACWCWCGANWARTSPRAKPTNKQPPTDRTATHNPCRLYPATNYTDSSVSSRLTLTPAGPSPNPFVSRYSCERSSKKMRRHR